MPGTTSASGAGRSGDRGRSSHLQRCCLFQEQVASIHQQTLRPQRLLVRDDGSTDGTQELLLLLKTEYGAWLHLLPADENLGCSANVNRLSRRRKLPTWRWRIKTTFGFLTNWLPPLPCCGTWSGTMRVNVLCLCTVTLRWSMPMGLRLDAPHAATAAMPVAYGTRAACAHQCGDG